MFKECVNSFSFLCVDCFHNSATADDTVKKIKGAVIHLMKALQAKLSQWDVYRIDLLLYTYHCVVLLNQRVFGSIKSAWVYCG